LQQAIQVAESSGGTVGEIRVAAGIYRPAGPGGDPVSAFVLVNGVSLLGGYGGCGESSPDDRDPAKYVTVLSGDLNGDDGPGFANVDDNSFNVVVGGDTDPTAVIDGFTITGGNADDFTLDSGGGMINDGGSPTVRNCTFRENQAFADGGGMYNVNSSSPHVSNCTFIGNLADNGGGMYNRNSSSPTLENCRFLGNEGARSAGGLRNQDLSNAVLSNCLFSGNFTSLGPANGGAVYNHNSSPVLTNCTLANNDTIRWGGGIYSTNFSSVTLTNCILWDNSAGTAGPEIVLKTTASPSSMLVRYSIVEGGQAAALLDAGSTLTWTANTNSTSNPQFVDAAGVDDVAGTFDDDLRLAVTSPGLDTGDPAVEPECGLVDLDGLPRVLCGRIDMGSYELGAGDFDCDGLVNLVDYAEWDGCVDAPLAEGCEAFHFDGGDCIVDLLDFARFQVLFGG